MCGFLTAEDPHFYTSIFGVTPPKKGDAEIKDCQKRRTPARYPRRRCFFGPAKKK
jgi:hypothetical protein